MHPRLEALRTRSIRTITGKHYTDNFGYQWEKFRKTQLDSYNGDTMSRDRLLLTLGMEAKDLVGKLVLEVGCGAGRFTEALLAMGAIVAAVDASSAVEVNARQNASDNVMFARASVYELPFEPGQFDIVICMGVLQHTPDRALTVKALAAQARPGGLVCVDSYPITFRRFLPSYVLRPLWSLLPEPAIQAVAYGYVECWWPFRRLFRKKLARGGAWLLSPVAPVIYYWNVSENKSDEFLKEWARLDTHDHMSPKHDVPQTRASLRRKFDAAGLADISVTDLSKARTPAGRIVSGFLAARGRVPA